MFLLIEIQLTLGRLCLEHDLCIYMIMYTCIYMMYIMYVYMIYVYTHREIILESFYSKPNLCCYYPFPIDLTPIGIMIGAKYIGKL